MACAGVPSPPPRSSPDWPCRAGWSCCRPQALLATTGAHEVLHGTFRVVYHTCATTRPTHPTHLLLHSTRFDAKAARVVKALTAEGFDFALLHVKAVDDTGHDRAPHLKLGYIEAVDRMVGQLLRGLWEAGGRCVVALAADHSTPVVFGDHSHEPVPVAVADVAHVVECVGDAMLRDVDMGAIAHPEDAGVEGLVRARQRHGQRQGGAAATVWDPVAQYDEVAAARGALGRFPGSELLPLLRRCI